MEEDRAATNVGPDVPDMDETMASEPAVVAKQPRKRFVGRKTGDKAEPSADPNANIEDSSAIQGVRRTLCYL
jgi:2-(3-amino-3-carboxypropyl)histidine synthase